MDNLKQFFERDPSVMNLFQLQQLQFNNARKRRVIMFSIGFFGLILLYTYAMYKQQFLINLMNREIRSDNPKVQAYTIIMGSRLSPQNLALVAEFPSLYWLLGYSNRYTGPLLEAIMQLESPTPERIVLAMSLLEGGLTVNSASTTPPTLFQELLVQVFPQDTYRAPNIFVPPTPAMTTFGYIKEALPFAGMALMLPMLFP